MKKQESAADIAGKAEKAAWRARERARVARWDVNIVVFLFAILITILILLFQGFGTEVVAPIGFVGLSLVWFVGWKRGRQLYEYFYYEELSKLEEEKKRAAAGGERVQ